MHRFVRGAGLASGLSDEPATYLADCLAGNDARGNFSHGSRQIATYARLMRDGTLNPTPSLTVAKESPVSVLVDGDGGLGYFPSREATRRTVDKALDTGIAIGMARNHGHFGAAGLYARTAVERGLCAYVTSGHQLSLEAGAPHYTAAGGSPMAFAVPTDTEPPVILDFGAMHDLYGGNPNRDELARSVPGLVLRSIGIGTICQMWGGFMSGLTSDPAARPWRWPGANQGALIICFRPDLFVDPEDLKAAVDEYARTVRTLSPLPGLDGVYLPGGIEAERERSYRANGIPVSDEHMKVLTELATELGIEPPTTRDLTEPAG